MHSNDMEGPIKKGRFDDYDKDEEHTEELPQAVVDNILAAIAVAHRISGRYKFLEWGMGGLNVPPELITAMKCVLSVWYIYMDKDRSHVNPVQAFDEMSNEDRNKILKMYQDSLHDGTINQHVQLAESLPFGPNYESALYEGEFSKDIEMSWLRTDYLQFKEEYERMDSVHSTWANVLIDYSLHMCRDAGNWSTNLMSDRTNAPNRFRDILNQHYQTQLFATGAVNMNHYKDHMEIKHNTRNTRNARDAQKGQGLQRRSRNTRNHNGGVFF